MPASTLRISAIPAYPSASIAIKAIKTTTPV
jgi:hypothetical protein